MRECCGRDDERPGRQVGLPGFERGLGDLDVGVFEGVAEGYEIGRAVVGDGVELRRFVRPHLNR